MAGVAEEGMGVGVAAEATAVGILRPAAVVAAAVGSFAAPEEKEEGQGPAECTNHRLNRRTLPLLHRRSIVAPAAAAAAVVVPSRNSNRAATTTMTTAEVAAGGPSPFPSPANPFLYATLKLTTFLT